MAEHGVPEFVERNADFAPAAARRRPGEPVIELRQRIRIQIRAIQAAKRVFPSDVRHAHKSSEPYNARATLSTTTKRLEIG